MEPVTFNEPSVIIMASNSGSLHLLKSMIARAHSRRDYAEAERLIEVRRVFREWIDVDRLQRARASEIILEIDEEGVVHGPIDPDRDKEPDVETEGEEKTISSLVLDDPSAMNPDSYDDR